MKRYCIPERDAARFVSQMEDVLDVYALPPEKDHPLVAIDEADKQLLGDTVEPLPMEPGSPNGKTTTTRVAACARCSCASRHTSAGDAWPA